MPSDQIAVSGAARYRGIPAATITWGTPGNQAHASATTYSATIFNGFEKSLAAQIAESKNNDGEVTAVNRFDKRERYTFAAQVTAATRALALATAENVPYTMDAAVLTRDSNGDGDTGDAGDAMNVWVESASLAYSPEGDAVISFVVVKMPQTLAAAS